MSDLTTSWHSYPKVHSIGHACIRDLLLDPVVIEEKVDGSQFSFGKFRHEDGELVLHCRSKGCQLNIDCPDKMFAAGVEVAKELFPHLIEGWTYRGEYLAKPKHNTLCYNRIPEKHIILFDINEGHELYQSRDYKEAEAFRLGLEVVPVLHAGPVTKIDTLRNLLDTESVLGGQKIEGFVVKNYKRFTLDGKAMMGKFVSEAFKEVHGNDWKERNPGNNDILEVLTSKYRTPARWAKAVQHMRESGQLEGSPRDIGKLIPETALDIKSECEAEIKDALFNWAWPAIQRGVLRGLPEWYKEELMKAQFEQ